MLSYASIFTASFIAALSGAMMPGPLLTVAVDQTARRGWLAAPILIAGHALLELLMVVALVFGLGRLLGLPEVTRAIGVIGGVFLLWMGWRIMRDVLRRAASLDVQADGSAKSDSSLILAGAATSLANPYWSLWWAAIGALILSDLAKSANPASLASFYLGHISGDFAWYGMVGLGVAAGRKILSDGAYRIILFACGAFLFLLAATFILGIPIFDLV